MLTWTGHVTCKQQEVLLNIELRVNKQKITIIIVKSRQDFEWGLAVHNDRWLMLSKYLTPIQGVFRSMQVNIDTNQSYTGKYWCGLLGHDRCFSDQLISSPTPGFKFFLLVQ